MPQYAPPPIWSEWVNGEREMIGGYPDAMSRDRFLRAQAKGKIDFKLLEYKK